MKASEMISYRESTFLGSSVPKFNAVKRWIQLACLTALGLGLVPEAAAQLKIMPLGDSITDGDKSSNLGGYRSRLFDKFKNSNHRTDFVGGLSGGTGFFDTQHEGHGGFNADEIRDNVLGYLSANPPQAVMLMIGTNDITAGQGVNAIRDEISTILDRIKQFNPKTEIYQATVTRRKDTKQAQVDQLNGLIRTLVSTKQGQGLDITLVDIDNLVNADLADNVHPNDTGYEKIADKFYNAFITKHAPSLETFQDDFNRTSGLGAAWNNNSAMKIVSNQLKNTSSVDNFDTFLAIATEITNPRLVSFKYGTGTDAVGRAFSGLSVMIDNPLFNKANGYLIFHNSQSNPKSLRLYEIKNGVPSASPIDNVVPDTADPVAGDVLQVEIGSDAQGHKFTVTINGVLDGILRDTNRLQGNASELYAGVQINGNTANAVDDFFATTAADLVEPDEVTDLAFLSATSSTASLEFTATGDDGKIGAAARYDVRYSTAPINGNNFNGANAANVTKTPSPAGAKDQVTVSGLDGGLEYFFAVKVVDEVGNVSKISNTVSGSTALLTTKKDDFNRTGPSLGNDWAAGSNLKIVSNTAQNTGTSLQAAVLKTRRNAQEVSIMLGPEVSGDGGRALGVLVMASDSVANPSGYLIRRRFENNREEVVLYNVVDGALGEIINVGPSLLAATPDDSSTISVIYQTTDTENTFNVFVDGQLDRILSDPQKRQSGKYAGFMLEPGAAATALEFFTVAVPIKAAIKLTKISGDNQVGQVNQALAEALVVKLNDEDNNPVVGKPVNFEVTPAGNATVDVPPAADGGIRAEAETGVITGPIEIRNDNDASRGKYVVYPLGQSADASVKISFKISKAGNYYIWTRSKKSAMPFGRWSVKIDGGAAIDYIVFDGEAHNFWDWDLLSDNTFNLAAGNHTIEFSVLREDTWLDKILVIADPAFKPNGLEDPGFTTDGEGFSSAQIVFGATAGQITISTAHAGLTPATFKAQASGGPATAMSLASGNNQTSAAGQTLAQPFVITVRDVASNVVAGHKVSWVITAGDGSLSNYTSTTGIDGKASTTLTLGVSQAAHKVQARSLKTDGSDLGAAIEFSATATGLPKNLGLVSGNNQTATVRANVATDIVVRATDASSNAIANVPLEINMLRGGGEVAAEASVLNRGFEATTTGGFPSNWDAEGSANASEAKTSANAPHGGARSLEINSSRAAEVGVSQAINYALNTKYVLTFYAKVMSGTARVRWELNDGSGNTDETVIDLVRNASNVGWTQYRLLVSNGQAGSKRLRFVTDNRGGNFFIDDVRLVPATGNNGRVSTTWTMGDTAGTQQVEFRGIADGTLLTGSPVKFSANATAGVAANLLKTSGDNQNGTAGQSLPQQLEARVTDLTGVNGVAGVNVKFSVIAGGGKLEGNVNNRTVATDANGYARTKYTLGPNNNVQNEVEATSSGLNGNPQSFISIAAVPGSFAASGGNNQKSSAGHIVATSLSVKILTQDNTPLSGYPVIFEVLEGNGTINKQKKDTLLTDNTGIARAPLRNGPTPGAINRVKASALFNGQNVTGSPFTFTVRTFGLKLIKTESGDAQEGVVGNFLPQPLLVAVLDSANKGIAEQKINFSVTAGGGVFKNNSANFTATTDTAGKGKAELKLGPQPIDNKVSASITPAISGSPRLFTAKGQVSAPDTLVRVSGDSASGVVGNPMPTPFVVKVTDRFNNGIDGVKVIFKVAGGGGHIAGQQADTITTANGGKAQIILTLGPTTNGAPYNNIVEARASNGAIPLRNSPMKFVATATASRARVMVDNGGNRQADGVAGVALNLPFRVLVKDGVGVGNPVTSHPVKFEVKRGTGKFANGKTDSTVFTASTGVAQIKLILGGETLPDSQIVVATANDGTNPLQGSNLRFVAFANAGNPSQAASNVFCAGSVRADNVTYKDVLVEIKDLFGNPVAGKFVVIEVSNGPNDIVQPNEVTNANGQAFAKFKSSKSGDKIVSAYIPSGIRLTNTATVTFLPLDANRVGLISGNNQKGNLNTATADPLVVKVGDKFNNGVPNSEVTFRVHSGAGKMSNGETSMKVTSGSDGQAEAYFIFGNATGESQIRAEAPGLINSPVIFLANGVNNPAKNLEYVSGNEQEGVAGETLAEPLVVKVTDNTSKAVFNTSVNFQISFGGGTLSAAGVKTNEYGEARVTLKLGENAGLNAVRVSSDGLDGSPIDFSAQAIGGRPCCVALLTAKPSGRVAGQSGPVRVQVVDGRGNGIDNYTVQFRLIKGTGSLTKTSVATTGGGIATTFVNFDNTSGYRYVQVIADGLAGSPITIPVYAQAEAAVTMQTVTRTNNQGGTVKKQLNFPLQVLFKDQYNNPSLGEGANFVITKGGGFLNGQSNVVSFSATSDSNGIAQVSLTLGAVAGENKVNALKSGGAQVPSVAFTATGFTNNFPVFNDVPDQKITETGAVEFVLSASDADGDGMTFGASNLPPGSAFDSLNTRVFRWQTTQSSAGVFEPAFHVRDGKGGVDVEVVRIEVLNRNRLPRLVSRNPIGFGVPGKADTTFKEGSDGVGRLRMSVKAADDDPGTVLHYSWYKDGQKVGKDSSGYQFIGLPGLSYVLCVISDGEDEIKTEWVVKVPVLLNSFSASAGAQGTVTLRWSTSAENYNAGFHMQRSQSLNGPFTRITAEMIPPRRDGSYSFIDDNVQAGAKYYYKLEDIDASGKSTLHGPVEALVTLPDKYDLSQNYPNPFNPTTNLEYQLPKPGRVQLTIYNTLGQKVIRLVNDLREAGHHTVLWNGRDQHGNLVPSGVYHYRLEVDGYVSTKKMVLAK